MRINSGMKTRWILDSCMLGVMFLLMAALTIGETTHEWLGIAETALVILHQGLNRKWYMSLFRGKYSAQRAAAAAVNILLLAAFLLTAVSGMAMSIHAVPVLYGMIPPMVSQRVHLSASNWCFILMGIHLGFHVPYEKITAGHWSGRFRKWTGGVIIVIAAAGLYLFFRNRIPDYLMFKTPFAYSYYNDSVILTLTGNMAMLSLWVFAGMQIAKTCRRRQKKY